MVDIMAWRDVSSDQLCKALGMSAKDFQSLLEGSVRITTAIANKISQILGGSAEFWLTRDLQYSQDLQDQNVSYSDWIDSVPLKEMVQLGWITHPKEASKVSTCLEFFGYSDPQKMVKAYQNVNSLAYYRTSKSFVSFPAPMAAWLRQGEIEANKVQCKNWAPEEFTKAMSEIRMLTRNKNPQSFIPKLQSICADCGIALIVIKAPSACKASGATFKIKDKSPVIILSARHLSDDHFWFTFFHEAGHVLLHQDNIIIVDEDRDGSLEEIEQEADAFAESAIVPNQYRAEFESLRSTYDDVLHFANKIGVSAGLIVGQLQNKGKLQPSHLNKAKRRYKWHENQLVSR